MKRMAHIVGWAMLILGALIFAGDAWIIIHCGFDVNDVYGITDNWGPIDWPTGLRPGWTFVPAFVYAIGFWLFGAVAFVLWPEAIKSRRYRILRGTE